MSTEQASFSMNCNLGSLRIFGMNPFKKEVTDDTYIKTILAKNRKGKIEIDARDADIKISNDCRTIS